MDRQVISRSRYSHFVSIERLEPRRHCDATAMPFIPIVFPPFHYGDETPPSVQMNYDNSRSEMANAGSAVSGTWATFTGTLASDQYTATIDWGDGTTSTGTIQQQKDGSFIVVGNHDYGTDGVFDMNVTVNASDGFSGSDWHEVLTDVDLPTFTSNADFWDETGDTDSQQWLTNFVDINPADASAYTASIDWGDGSRSAGTVIDNGDGTFGITGTHAYASAGQYTVSVAVAKGAESAQTSGTADIEDPPPVDDSGDDGDGGDNTDPSDWTEDPGTDTGIYHPIFVVAAGSEPSTIETLSRVDSLSKAQLASPPPANAAAAHPFSPIETYSLNGDTDPRDLVS